MTLSSHLAPLIRNKIFHIFILITLILFVTYPAWDAYFHSDDFEYLNRKLEPGKIFLANKEGVRYEGGRYRPITIISILIDRALWSLNPAGYNFSNKILHAICTLEVLYFMDILFPGDKFRSFLAALIFSVHPVFTDTIFWISARPDSLCCIFYILAIILFLKAKSYKLLVISYISFLLSLMSKEMAVTLPLIIFITDFILIQNLKKGLSKLIDSFKISLPYFIILLSYMFFRLIFLGSVIGGTGNTNFAFLRVLLNLKDAFYLLTFPMSRYDLIIFFILIIFLSSGKLRKYILNREILYCSLWIFLTLIPVFGLITRWYMYIPSIGLCMMLSIIITSLAKINFYFKITLSVIFIFFLSLNIYLLRKEACLWNSSGKLVKTITEDIYSYSKDRETFYIFNLPAALLDSDFFSSGEKPVFAYNIEKAVNTIYSSKLYIYPVTTVFLLNIDGGCEILKTGENKFLLKLDERKSRFSYHRDEFISGRVVPALGVEIENDKFILTTDKLNSEVIVEFKDHISNNSLFEFRKGHIVPLNLSGSR